VIGNPPYGATLSEEQDTYLRKIFNVASYQLNTYSLFVEQASIIADNKGLIGFIIPSAWVASVYDIELREFLYKNVGLNNIVITPKHTFKDATVETLIIIYSNKKNLRRKFNVERWDGTTTSYEISFDNIDKLNYSFPVYSNPKILKIIDKVNSISTVLDDFAEVIWGVKVYEKGKGIPPQKGNENNAKIFHSSKKESNTHRPLIGGKEIFRYNLNWRGTFLDYGKWLAAPRKPDWFQGARIVVREVTAKGVIHATIIEGDYVFSNSVDGIRLRNDNMELKYLLGIINSKIISFYHLNTSPNAFKGTFPKILLKDLRKLPIIKPPKEIEGYFISLVDNLLKLNKQLQTTKLDSDRQQIQRAIDHAEKKIDELVYELYGLTEEEIEIIENN